jgi:hypothetical protein
MRQLLTLTALIGVLIFTTQDRGLFVLRVLLAAFFVF